MAWMGKNIKFHQRGQVHADGELWIVSYADMMTLLFGFFVILFAISKLDEDRLQSVGKQLAETFRGDVEEIKSRSEVGMMMQARQIRALQLLVAMLNLGDSVEEAVDKIEKQVRESKDFGSAKAAIMDGIESDDEQILTKLKSTTFEREDRIEIAIPDGVLFNSGTAELTPPAKVGIRKMAKFLNRVKGLVGMEVVGHTDSIAPSKKSLYPNNWALSSARAGAVADELIRNGVSPKHMEVRGMASLQPLFPERRADGSLIADNLSRNRRVHLIIKKSRDGN